MGDRTTGNEAGKVGQENTFRRPRAQATADRLPQGLPALGDGLTSYWERHEALERLEERAEGEG